MYICTCACLQVYLKTICFYQLSTPTPITYTYMHRRTSLQHVSSCNAMQSAKQILGLISLLNRTSLESNLIILLFLLLSLLFPLLFLLFITWIHLCCYCCYLVKCSTPRKLTSLLLSSSQLNGLLEILISKSAKICLKYIIL